MGVAGKNGSAAISPHSTDDAAEAVALGELLPRRNDGRTAADLLRRRHALDGVGAPL